MSGPETSFWPWRNFCTRAELSERCLGGAMIPNSWLSRLRILVVEDEGLIALNLERMLHHFGCEVIGPISEIGHIIDAVRKHCPDGALLDVNLRGRKVFDVLPELTSFGVPFVLISGYDDPTLFPAAFRDLPRIAKPFDESATAHSGAFDPANVKELAEHVKAKFAGKVYSLSL